jgi:hypothetical protein
MMKLDEKLSVLAGQVLKRPLSEEERLEIYRISDAVGMRDVQSFLHLLLVFRLHEDTVKKQFEQLDSLESRLNAKFDDMGVLSKRIDGTLTGAVERILGEGAKRIGADMSEAIVSGARDTLTQISEFHSLRGQMTLTCFMTAACCLAYWFGSADVFNPEVLPRSALTFLPLGWGIFFFCLTHTYLWACDNWKQIKRRPLYKTFFGLQIFSVIISYLVML